MLVGIFYEDRFMPVVEVISNIAISIILVKLIGLSGIFIGTVVSSGIVVVYGNAKYVYKPLFGKERANFLLEHLKYILMAILVTCVSSLITGLIHLDNNYLQVAVNIGVCLIIPNLIYMAILYKTDEFQYYKGFVRNLLHRNNTE